MKTLLLFCILVISSSVYSVDRYLAEEDKLPQVFHDFNNNLEKILDELINIKNNQDLCKDMVNSILDIAVQTTPDIYEN